MEKLSNTQKAIDAINEWRQNQKEFGNEWNACEFKENEQRIATKYGISLPELQKKANPIDISERR